jgi:regulator of RNase E activity RraA
VSPGGNEILPFLSDVPVCVDGVTIVPGDYIFARGSAAVVLPGPSAEEILTSAHEIMKKMDGMKSLLVNEDPVQVLEQGSSEL